MLQWSLHVPTHTNVIIRRAENISGQMREVMLATNMQVGHMRTWARINTLPKASATCGAHSRGQGMNNNLCHRGHRPCQSLGNDVQILGDCAEPEPELGGKLCRMSPLIKVIFKSDDPAWFLDSKTPPATFLDARLALADVNAM